MSSQTLYDILGVVPSAALPQIEKAYRRALDLYSEGSLATYTLVDHGEQEALRQRVQHAYDVLRDPARRTRYDEELRSQDEAPEAAAAPTSFVGNTAVRAPMLPTVPAPRSVYAPAPARPTLPEPVTGAALRTARESSGVTLQQIASASKVGVRTLESIENERLDILPAPVYLRGFVQEYARCLGLDPRATADSYVARIRILQG